MWSGYLSLWGMCIYTHAYLCSQDLRGFREIPTLHSFWFLRNLFYVITLYLPWAPVRVFRAVDQNLQFCGLPPFASLLPPETFTFSSRKPIVLNKSSLDANIYWNVLAKLAVLIMEAGGAWGSGDAPQGRTGTWSASRTAVMRHHRGRVRERKAKGSLQPLQLVLQSLEKHLVFTGLKGKTFLLHKNTNRKAYFFRSPRKWVSPTTYTMSLNWAKLKPDINFSLMTPSGMF